MSSPSKLRKPARVALGVVLTIGLVIGGILLIAGYENYKDQTTRIEHAQVISKEKKPASRRSLPRYILVIQEQGSQETREVQVTLGAWVWCEPGDIFNDLPGEQGACEQTPPPRLGKS